MADIRLRRLVFGSESSPPLPEKRHGQSAFTLFVFRVSSAALSQVESQVCNVVGAR